MVFHHDDDEDVLHVWVKLEADFHNDCCGCDEREGAVLKTGKGREI